jgi:hypothetical protein
LTPETEEEINARIEALIRDRAGRDGAYATAWALLKAVEKLDDIADWLDGVDERLHDVLDALKEKKP